MSRRFLGVQAAVHDLIVDAGEKSAILKCSKILNYLSVIFCPVMFLIHSFPGRVRGVSSTKTIPLPLTFLFNQQGGFNRQGTAAKACR